MATRTTKVISEEVVANPTETVNETTNEVAEREEVVTNKRKNAKQVINELLAAGCKKFVNIKVKTAKVTEKEDRNGEPYYMISLNLSNDIPAYVADEDGVFVKSINNIIFTSSFSLNAVIRENEEIGWCVNQLNRNPRGFEVLLAGASIDIIQEEVSGDEIYTNPFSNRKVDEDSQAYGHDAIINHIINIKPSAKATKLLDMIAIRMLAGDSLL